MLILSAAALAGSLEDARPQDPQVRAVIMTGDATPGVTEEFAYFRAVHALEDGGAGFSAVTTRTGSFFRNVPRGIYHFNPSGLLTVIAEIDDEDAFRTVGVPESVMDSRPDAAFAFDYLSTMEFDDYPVVARRRLGEPVEALTPDDGTPALVSHPDLPANSFYDGRFIFIHGGISLNAQNAVLFDASFEFSGDGSSERGLFLAFDPNTIRNIVFEGHDSPGGLTDVFLATVRGAQLADNGSVFFSSTLAGVGASSATDETIWMESGGSLELILQEGSDAPGLPGMRVNGASLNLLLLALNGEHALFFGGAAKLGGTVHRTLWLGDTSGGTLVPVIQAASSPVLEQDEYFTMTDQGPIAFTAIDTGAVYLDDSGRVYLVAAGLAEDGSSLAGLWMLDRAAMTWALLVEAEPDMANLRLLAANNLAGTAFLAETGGVDAVWTRAPDAELQRIMAVGDMVAGRAVTSFADHATYSGTAGETTKTLGTPAKFTQLNDSGDLVFVARFDDTDDDDDSRADEAIMLAASAPPQTERYLWTDGAGDGDWHTLQNWDDLDTRVPATRTPGDEPGTEEVVIPSSGVEISGRGVRLKHIDANGALFVKQPLSLSGDSSIEGLELEADLETGAGLDLDAASQWLTGGIAGSAPDAAVTVNGSLDLVGAPDGGSDMKDLNVKLIVPGTVNHKDGVTLDISDGLLSIESGGRYTLGGGGAAVTSAQRLTSFIENRGEILATGGGAGGDTAAIRSDVRHRGGSITVSDGRLRMEGVLEIEGGDVEAASGATLEVAGATVGPAHDHGIIVREHTTVRGKGDFLVRGGFLDILEDKTLSLEMDMGTGSAVMDEGVSIEGDGSLENHGPLDFMDASSTVDILNKGKILVSSVKDGSNLTANGGEIVNEEEMRIEGRLGLGQDATSGSPAALTNFEIIRIGGGGDIVSSPPYATLTNHSDLIKDGADDSAIGCMIDHRGFLKVLEGVLSLTAGGRLGSSDPNAPEAEIFVGNGAKLVLNNSSGAPGSVYDIGYFLRFSGEGEVMFPEGNLRVPQGGTITNNGVALTIESSDAAILLDASVQNESGALRFGGSAQPVVELRNFSNSKSATAVFDDGSSLDADEVRNEGEVEFRGGDATVTSRFPVVNLGTLVFSGGGANERSEFRVDASYLLGVNGKVHLKDFAAVTFTRAEIGPAAGVLKGGTWEAEPGCEIVFRDDFNGPEIPIREIGPDAHVILHGSGATGDEGNVGGLLSAPPDFINAGSLILSEATLRPRGSFLNARFGVISGAPGRIEIPAGNVLRNAGTIVGETNLVGEVVNEGTISIGQSPGLMHVEGGYRQGSDGNLLLELGGAVAGSDYDQLLVSGVASLGGTLTLGCVDGVFPPQGAAFEPLVAGSFLGDFDQIVSVVPSGRQRFVVSQSESGLVAQADVIDVSAFTEWQAAVFTPQQLADDAVSGPNANPDRDLLTNVEEYVFDGNPLVATHPPVVFSLPAGLPQTIEIRFPWASGLTDYTFAVECSNSLSIWETLDHTVVETIDRGHVMDLTITAALPPGAAETDFVRVVLRSL